MISIELRILAWGCLLALIHVFAAGQVRTKQYGTKWNMGARDEDLPPPSPLVGRMERAQANFFETFPIVAAAILMIEATHRTSATTMLGAMLWLGARVIYLPLYAAGIPVVRSVAFMVSMVGIVMLLWPLLR